MGDEDMISTSSAPGASTAAASRSREVELEQALAKASTEAAAQLTDLANRKIMEDCLAVREACAKFAEEWVDDDINLSDAAAAFETGGLEAAVAFVSARIADGIRSHIKLEHPLGLSAAEAPTSAEGGDNKGG